MRALCGVLALAILPDAAAAQTAVTSAPNYTVVDYGTSQVGVMLGTDTSWSERSPTFRVTLQSGHDVFGNDQFAIGGNMPITYVTEGSEEFGISTNNVAFEFPPSLRLRLWPNNTVRLYVEIGVGLVWLWRNQSTDFYTNEDEDLGFMTRSALGLEIGKPSGFMLLVEPLGTRTYWLSDSYGRVGIMIGGGLRM